MIQIVCDPKPDARIFYFFADFVLVAQAWVTSIFLQGVRARSAIPT
jgi:hypothetical protein